MAIGPWQIILIVVVALLIFGGGGRISSMMGDFAKGIRSFRKGLQDEQDKSVEDKVDAAVDVTPTADTEKAKSDAS